jgi:hypothetical protein
MQNIFLGRPPKSPTRAFRPSRKPIKPQQIGQNKSVEISRAVRDGGYSYRIPDAPGLLPRKTPPGVLPGSSGMI